MLVVTGLVPPVAHKLRLNKSVFHVPKVCQTLHSPLHSPHSWSSGGLDKQTTCRAGRLGRPLGMVFHCKASYLHPTQCKPIALANTNPMYTDDREVLLKTIDRPNLRKTNNRKTSLKPKVLKPTKTPQAPSAPSGRSTAHGHHLGLPGTRQS